MRDCREDSVTCIEEYKSTDDLIKDYFSIRDIAYSIFKHLEYEDVLNFFTAKNQLYTIIRNFGWII